MAFRNFINSFRNARVAQAVVANMNFQEELFNLGHSGKPLPNLTNRFKPPSMVRRQYSNREIKNYDYENRDPKTACVDYVFWIHISEIKNNLGIDANIAPNISGFNMQKHDDQYKLWAHA